MKPELSNYKELLQDLRSLLTKSKYQAYKAVDNLLVQTYWQMGERITRESLIQKRADYGQEVVPHLAQDLLMQKSTLYDILHFYAAYPIFHAVRGELSWTHYRLLMRLNHKAEREFYESQIIGNGWSSRQLDHEIKHQLYHRAAKQGSVTVRKKLPVMVPELEHVFKDAYHFDFLNLKKKYNEKEFKDALLHKLEKFLQELGPSFFIGRREVPILISGNYDKVDLELFHAGLLCYILVEIKTEQFQHKHVSQMYSYLNWYKQHKMQEGQRHPIGLIICKTKDDETVHYALGDLKKEIFVAEYKTRLPPKEKILKMIQ